MTVFPSIAALLALFVVPASAQQKTPPSDATQPAGMPTSGGYQPPALSLDSLILTDKDLQAAMTNFYATGDSDAFRKAIEVQAATGSIGAELLLAEQYIPEQCTFQPDQDVPHCGAHGEEAPKVIFRANPLGLSASYVEAARWLEHASQRGSGEASEILAQLITRMLSNGHVTTYTAADSMRLHALARSQGFDVEPLTVTCYQLSPAQGDGLSVTALPHIPNQPPLAGLSQAQLINLRTFGVHGTLTFQGSSGAGDSTLLSRPQGPPVSVAVILDHDPGKEIHLPIPAHHDAIYIQRGDAFLPLPSGVPTLNRILSVMPQRNPDYRQVTIFTQRMDGSMSGGSCARF
jgi:hypothetical protein